MGRCGRMSALVRRRTGATAWWMRCGLFSVMAALLLAGCSATPSRTTTGSFDPDRVMVAADGRRYRVERVPKTPGSYVWTGTDTVRYYPFAIYVVDRQDDQYLYVRQYLPTPSPPPRPATAEAIDSADLATSSEFAVRDFGAGL